LNVTHRAAGLFVTLNLWRVAEVRVSSTKTRVLSIKTRVSSIKNGRIRCFLLIQLKLKTQVVILETRGFKLET